MPAKKSINNSVNPLRSVGYTPFDNENKEKVFSAYGKTIEKFEGVMKTQADASSTQMRAPFNPYDYARQRPFDNMPRHFRDIVIAARLAYIKVGVIRNVIDLMTDFAAQDLQIIHGDKRVEAFFKVWAYKTNLKEVINEFIRHFFIDGNVVVSRTIAKLTKPVEMQWIDKMAPVVSEKAKALDSHLLQDGINDTSVPRLKVERTDLKSREIPWRYSFININALEWVGGLNSKDDGERRLAFKISESLMSKLRTPSDPFQQILIDRLPPGVVQNLKSDKDGYIELDMSKVFVCHNKKDSWEDWSLPFLYSVLNDVHFKDKLRQAETAALDGVINVIRLWKLGDHKEKILPADGAIDRLIDILQNNTGGGTLDIVWDSMIEMQDFYPPIDKILGAEKYQQVNSDILVGLGVPEVLIGGDGTKFSNSFIQLKALVEKLNYARNAVVRWLYGEITIVCDTMDIPVLPKIKFGQMDLEDASANKKLIVGLLDRGIISAEAVLRAYGEDFLIEIQRMTEEKKIKVLDTKGPFDQTPTPKTSPVGISGQGRPPGDRNAGQTKTRVAKPKTFNKSKAGVIKGIEVVDAIDEYITPIYMDIFGLTNARKLTSEQKDEINEAKLLVLACIKPIDGLSRDNVIRVAESSNSPNMAIINRVKEFISDFVADQEMLPTLAQRKVMEALSWSEFNESQGDEDAQI